MQCSRAVKKEQRTLIQHQKPKDILLSEGKRYRAYEHSHYITGQGKEQERKMTVYAFDRLRKQTLDQENNRKRGKTK